jgi:hypothetical protein
MAFLGINIVISRFLLLLLEHNNIIAVTAIHADGYLLIIRPKKIS